MLLISEERREFTMNLIIRKDPTAYSIHKIIIYHRKYNEK
jgi:hypothetical protein